MYVAALEEGAITDRSVATNSVSGRLTACAFEYIQSHLRQVPEVMA